MNILARYIHGSEDSIDCDVIYMVDEVPSQKDAKAFCCEDPTENRNVAVVRNGRISWCYKGFTDEVNNSLLATYVLHRQNDRLLVTERMERDLLLKLLAVLRKLLMELRHASIRHEARKALKAGYSERVRLLEQTVLPELEWIIPETERLERVKTMAFQLGQALSLHERMELYTKSALAKYDASLKPYLYREPCSLAYLEDVKIRFLKIVSDAGFEDCGDLTVRVSASCARYIALKGKEAWL